MRSGRVVARAQPDAVINELTDLPQSLNPRKLNEYYAANNRVRREGTAKLLDAARGAGVRRFLVQSAAYWYAPSGGPVSGVTDTVGGVTDSVRGVTDNLLGGKGKQQR